MGIICYYWGLDLKLKCMAYQNLKKLLLRPEIPCITMDISPWQLETMNGILPTTLREIQGPTVFTGSPNKVEFGHK